MCTRALTGCPARSGSRPAVTQPAHCLVQPVVVPLGLAAGVLRAGRGRQCVQHRPDDRRAFRRQVAGQDARALEGRLQLDRPVLERLIPVLVRVLGQGPGVDLAGQPGQVPQVHPRLRRRQENLVRGRTAVFGESVRPLADGPGVGLRYLPRSQHGRHFGMRGGPADPRGVGRRGTSGDPGLVDQPGSGAVVRVRAVSLAGGERRQYRSPRSGAYRGGPLEHLQAPRLGLRRHRGGVRVGQVLQPRVHHVHRLVGAGKRWRGLHPGRHLLSRCSRAGVVAGLRVLLLPVRTGALTGHVSRFSVRF